MLAFEIKLGDAVGDSSSRHLHWLGREIGDELLDRVIINAGPAAYRRQDGIAVIPASLTGP